MGRRKKKSSKKLEQVSVLQPTSKIEEKIFHSSFYNIKTLLGYYLLYEYYPNDLVKLYMKHINYSYFIPLEQKGLIEEYSSMNYNPSKIYILLVWNILDYVLSRDKFNYSKVKDHYFVQCNYYTGNKQLTNLTMGQRKTLRSKLLAKWETVDRLINFFIDLQKRYQFVFYKEYVQWFDGINHFYDYVPAIMTNDKKNFEFIFIIQHDASFKFTLDERDLMKIPSLSRCLGYYINNGLNISKVTLLCFNIERDFILRVREYTDIFNKDFYIKYLSVYGDNKNWNSPLSYYPHPSFLYKETPTLNLSDNKIRYSDIITDNRKRSSAFILPEQKLIDDQFLIIENEELLEEVEE